MTTEPTKSNFDKILNAITRDCLILIFLIIFGLLIFGTIKEHGDSNAGSMYGLYIIPIIPILLVALGLIQTSKFYLKPQKIWLNSLTPTILIILGIWLKSPELYILISALIIIIMYNLLKDLIRKDRA